MGIDIRNGQQLACITCGLCIDACNDMMDKIGKPRHLIGYLALTDEKSANARASRRNRSGNMSSAPHHPLHRAVGRCRHRPGRGAVPAHRDRRQRDPGAQPAFVTLSDGSIRNTYDLRLRNKHGDDRWFYISATSGRGLTSRSKGPTVCAVLVPANETLQTRVYITAAPDSAAARRTGPTCGCGSRTRGPRPSRAPTGWPSGNHLQRQGRLTMGEITGRHVLAITVGAFA
jgi:polyferredoxin